MIKLVQLYLLISFALFACQDDSNDKEENVEPKEEISDSGDLASRAKRHVQAQLQISATENYTLRIDKAQLDNDGIEDAIISVNRLSFALEKAKQSPNTAKLAEIGYVGNYNFLFFYDGGLDMISPAIVVPSSPYLPLSISFESITSTEYKDVLVQYRIRNSAYRAFFTIENHTLSRYFEWPEFDELGTNNAKAYVFEYLSTANQPRKNILVYPALIELNDSIRNFNTAKPKLIKQKKMIYEFFYLPSQKKYVTYKQ